MQSNTKGEINVQQVNKQYKFSSITITHFRERCFANITLFQINYVCSVFINYNAEDK